MNNEEKNLHQNDESVEIDNENAAPEVQDGAKKPSTGFLTLIITLVACVLVAVIMIVALLPKNNDGSGNGEQGGSTGGQGDSSGDKGDETTNSKTEYIISVVDQNGNAVKGVEVTFYTEDGVNFPRTTDAEGCVYYTTAKGVQVAVTALPDKYDYIKLNQKQTPAKDGKLTLTVEREADEFFEVYVVDQYNNPVAGVTVQICALVCKSPQVTDAEGKAYFAYDPTLEYHAQLTNGLEALPDGYTIDDADQYFYFDGKVATIRVTKL